MNLDLTINRQRYIRQKGAVGRLASILAGLGLLEAERNVIAVVGGKTALELTFSAVEKSFSAAAAPKETRLVPVWYGGQCSLENVAHVSASLQECGANLVVGAGGGKAIDTAKAAAYRVGLPLVTLPTIAATCAALTPLSVLYDADGHYLRMEYDVEVPAAIIVDTSIIAAAPRHYLRSGIGDTLAKKAEIRAATERFFKAQARTFVGTLSPANQGLAAAARTFAEQAFSLIATVLGSDHSAKNALGDSAAESVVESVADAVILFGGLASSFAGHGARTACAHAIHDALTILPESRRFHHGELVSVGIVCQAILEKRTDEEVAELVGLLRRAELPCCLRDLGIAPDPGGKTLRQVAEMAATSEDMGNMPMSVSTDDVLGALLKTNHLASRFASSTSAISSPDALAQPAARQAEPYVGSIYDEEGPAIAKQLGLASVIKLSFNENTLGPSPKALAAMHEAVERAAFYPDHTGRCLRAALATQLGLAVDSVVLANGADEMISLVCQSFIRPGLDEVVISAPTFGSYRSSAIVAGASIREVPLIDFRHDIDALIRAVTPRTKLLFLCNPNNPTGRHATGEEIDRLVQALPPSTILVLDEAYIDYVTATDFPDALKYLRTQPGSGAGSPNVIIIRTFSKIHGLAGVRIGYGLARPELARFLQAVRLPVNINRVALAGALASLSDQEHVARVRDLVIAEKQRLYREFAARGLSFQPSEANFILVDVGLDSESVCRAALSHGVVLRPGRGFGLPTHVRFTVGSPAENDAALRALDKALDSVRDDSVHGTLSPENSSTNADQGVA